MAHNVCGFDGPAEKLANVLLNRSDVFVDQVYFPLLKINKPKTLRIYETAEKIKIRKRSRLFGPPISYLFDILKFINFRKYDHGISFNPLCTIILAMQFPYRARVISTYYVDSHISKYENSLANSLYRLLEKLSYKISKNIIDTSKEVQDYKFSHRIYFENIREKRFIVSPISYSNKLIRDPKVNGHPKRIVYFGNVNKRNGVDKLVEISANLGPEYIFDVIGEGELSSEIYNKVKHYGIANRFNFFGYISSLDTVFDIMAKSSIGIAPFSESETNTYTYLADPGKIRAYIICGLPFITSNATMISSEYITQKIGVVLPEKSGPKEYALEIKKLFKNTNLLDNLQNNVYELRKLYTDEIVFNDLVDKLIL
jgi:glycosyltransferase involved in cell wall biosynthesis